MQHFLNPHGMPLTNTEITFNINGIFYKKMTNNDGMAELKINLESWKLYNNNY